MEKLTDQEIPVSVYLEELSSSVEKKEESELCKKTLDATINTQSHSPQQTMSKEKKGALGENAHEESIKSIFEKMRQLFAQKGPLPFGKFWQLKQECLEFFKGRFSQKVRSALWSEYKELSSRFHQLKAIVDEQALFIQQQIALALDALDEEVKTFFSSLNEGIKQSPLGTTPSFLQESRLIAKKRDEYERMVFQIRRLETFVEKIQALRKETLHTPLRSNKKNGFLQRLKVLADRIMPALKAKTHELSALFFSDVSQFVSESSSRDKRGYMGIKEEIKALQKIAKELPLELATFTKTRHELSHLWEKIKVKEGEDREAKGQIKTLSLEKLGNLLPMIEEFKEKCLHKTCSLIAIEEEMSSILRKAKELHLEPQDWKTVKSQLIEARQKLEERMEERKTKEKTTAQEQKEIEQRATGSYIEEVLHLLHAAEGFSREALVGKWEDLLKRREGVSLTALEESWLGHRLGSIKDHIIEKSWKELRETQKEGVADLLKSLLQEGTAQKRELKEEIEGLRKWCGRMSLSVQDALEYQELIAAQKMRLEGIEAMLEEMEEFLYNLEEG